MAVHASQMYAKNISTLLKYLTPQGELVLNFGDDIVDAACVTHEGQVRNPRVLQLLHPAQTLATTV